MNCHAGHHVVHHFLLLLALDHLAVLSCRSLASPAFGVRDVLVLARGSAASGQLAKGRSWAPLEGVDIDGGAGLSGADETGQQQQRDAISVFIREASLHGIEDGFEGLAQTSGLMSPHVAIADDALLVDEEGLGRAIDTEIQPACRPDRRG